MSFTTLTEYLHLCLSTDVKTTTGITIGSKCIETDTDHTFIFDGSAWIELENVAIVSEHKRVHLGLMWDITALFETVADDAHADLTVTSGSKELHCIYAAASEGNAHIFVYEAPTTSAGSAALVKNANRVTGDSGAPIAIKAPTVGNVGTRLTEGFIAGGRGGNAGGGGDERGTEIILAPSTKYLFRVTNKKGSNGDIGWALHAYEHN